jgi:predicted N-acyltransferase
MNNAGYGVEVYDSIRQVDLGEWNSLRDATSDPFMDPRFIEAVEIGFAKACRFRHGIVRDSQGRPMAIACLSSYSIGGASLAKGRLQKVLAGLERAAPWFFRSKLILCGLPVSAGQSHLRFAPEADRAEVLRHIDRVACQFARREWARLILFKEIDEAACSDLGPLESLGYRRADSFPMNRVEPGSRDFADYLSKFPSKKRRPIRRSQKRIAENGLRIVELFGRDGVTELYTDAVHCLYEAVATRSAVQFEQLPAEFPRELARRMPDNTVFTLIYRDAEVVGFSMSLVSDTTFHGMVLGVDYEVNAEAEVYFNLLYQSIDSALRHGAQEICIGQTTDALKHDKLDCYQVPLSIYVKGGRWTMKAVLRAGFSSIFPPRPLLYPRERAGTKADDRRAATVNDLEESDRPGPPRSAVRRPQQVRWGGDSAGQERLSRSGVAISESNPVRPSEVVNEQAYEARVDR